MQVSGRQSGLWGLILVVWLLGGNAGIANGQQNQSGKFWVVFQDKANVPFDPYAYFEPKALERRQRQNLPLFDETDKPLRQDYVHQVALLSDSVSGQSRWLNAVACYADFQQLARIRNLPFVKQVVPFLPKQAVLASASNEFETSLTPEQQKVLFNQTASLGAEILREKQLDGKGLRIAVLDAGFKSLQTNPAFEHLRLEKRIVKTFDFVKCRENVDGYSTHGTMVLSCITGKLEGKQIGLATGAEFLLARTERQHSERFSEEEMWLAAMEWADKNGADIINSSLGYTNDRYFREQMDGKTAFVARAANMAARKGMLVVNAIGNDGSNKTWKILGTPADADSVLAVAGIDPNTLFHAGFSSYGPTSDKRLKPNVSAFGIVVAAGPEGFTSTQGTSFSSPLVAGFAACAWQSNRQLTNMQLFSEIEKSGSLYPYYDYAHGYGVPQAARFLGEAKTIAPTFALKKVGNQLQVRVLPQKTDSVNSGSDQAVTYRAMPVNFEPIEYLYYHLANPKGSLDQYFVVEVQKPEVATINLAQLKPGTTIRFFYRGYYQDFTL